MFQDLINATVKMINDPNFIPYHPNNYSTARQFELYINKLLLLNLGPTYSRNSIPGYGRRKFDIKRYDNGKWLVCEIGHEKSSRGYLHTRIGNPNRMGLINKLFFDYIKNYRCKGLVPRSYAFLYFSLEQGFSQSETNQLFDTIKNLYQPGQIWDQDVILGGFQYGRILIIDYVSDLSGVRVIYRNNHRIHQYVNPNETCLNKHNILMAFQNPPY